MPFTQLEQRVVYTRTSKITQMVEVTYADDLTELAYDDHEGGEPDAIIRFHKKLKERVVGGHIRDGRRKAKAHVFEGAKAKLETERRQRVLTRTTQ